MSDLLRDERGLAAGFLNFVAILVISALLYALMLPVINSIETMLLSQVSSPQATNVIEGRIFAFKHILYFIVLYAGVYIIARAVFESEVAG